MDARMIQGEARSHVIGSAIPAERPTDMENLSNMTGENRRRLREALHLIEARLDNFTSAPSTLSSKGETAPEPQPGTLGSLRHMATSTGDELNRLEAICSRLSEIL